MHAEPRVAQLLHVLKSREIKTNSTIAENSHRYLALRKHSKIRRRNRCGQTPPYEPPNNRPSSDRKDKPNNKDKQGRQATSKCKIMRTMIHHRASFLVLATTIGLEVKGEWGNCLAVRSRRQATSKNSHHWAVLRERLDQIGERDSYRTLRHSGAMQIQTLSQGSGRHATAFRVQPTANKTEP